ncbi:MAG: 23S rRNA (uracil(1939)-C(5))-methyltransferase RlmD [Gammaproteobacteria bacterium]|nr:23S rRNA (uracil(1939)-C(5))-methyltransferase RlmD [Gammaproteobacteria bacterium]
MPRLSPLQKKLKLKHKDPSAKQQNALAQAAIDAVTLPKGKHIELLVDDFSHDGRGVGRWHGKTLFVAGSLPGERVQAEVLQDHKNYAEAKLLQVVQASDLRQQPPCTHHHECGGCQLQHLLPEQQVKLKQTAITQQLSRIAKVELPSWQTPLAFSSEGYRRRAQLATRYFADSHTLLLGFRQAGHRHIVPVQHCLVLVPALDKLLEPLREAILTANDPAIYSHIELIQTEQQLLVVLQAQAPLAATDIALWHSFAEQQRTGVEVRQADNSVSFFGGADGVCQYQLPALSGQTRGLTIGFASQDFIQVNAKANAAMVQQAMDWLDVQPDDKVLDLFCGAGNFSLPAASLGAQVLGVEGDSAMVQRASDNAHRNALQATFKQADLFAPDASKVWRGWQFNKLLMDPPRAGAKNIENILREHKIEKLVYISCNPASMARDLRGLQKLGLRVVRAGCIDMFPHTPHLEVMTLLEKV